MGKSIGINFVSQISKAKFSIPILQTNKVNDLDTKNTVMLKVRNPSFFVFVGGNQIRCMETS